MLFGIKCALIGFCLTSTAMNDLDAIKEVADLNGLLTFVKGYRVAIVDNQLSGSLEATKEFLNGNKTRNQVSLPPYTIAVIASPGVTKGVFLELGAPLSGFVETGAQGPALDVNTPMPNIGVP